MTLEDIISGLNHKTYKEVSPYKKHGTAHGIKRILLKDKEGARFLLKYTDSAEPSILQQLASEAQGLQHFKQVNLRTPLAFYSDSIPGILMKYISETQSEGGDIAEQIASLHRNTADTFHYPMDTYIASIPLNNSARNNWAEFYWFNRIQPLIKHTVSLNLLPQKYLHSQEDFINAIRTKVPDESPRLLHGDLWAGNYLTDKIGRAFLIDPAIYYGHREMDIAMSKLFGGFNVSFYRQYDEMLPLEPGWQERLPYFQLYYLMAHVVLFGKAYSNSTIEAWERLLA